MDTPKRVKIYHLQNEVWVDQGTGFCTGIVDDQDRAFLVVENEEPPLNTLLRSHIQGSTQYQKQQDTLILWTNEDGIDVALSFQEPEGCALVCDFLVHVQRHVEPQISLVAVLGDDSGASEVICGPIEYPPNPSMNTSILSQIATILQVNLVSMEGCSEISKFLVLNRLFVPDLVAVFEQLEKEKNLANLHRCCTIIKTLILYNESPIFDLLFTQADCFLGVVGILEYDPDFPTHRSKFRDYLKKNRVKEIVPLEDPHICQLVMTTFNLQFLKDVVLARLLDDAASNAVSTIIYFNQVEIVNYMTENSSFLSALFDIYNSDNGPEKKRDGVRMVHQYVCVAKSLQVAQRTSFFRALLERGMLLMVQYALKSPYLLIRVAGVEVVVAILENDSLLFTRLDEENTSESSNENPQSLEKQHKLSKKDARIVTEPLMEAVTSLLVSEPDPGLKLQAYHAIRAFLQPRAGCWWRFYTLGASVLFGPLIKMVASGEPQDVLADLLCHLCELIPYCAKSHFKQGVEFILKNRLLESLNMLQDPAQHKKRVRLAAVRCLRHVIMTEEEALMEEAVRLDLLRRPLEMLIENKENGGLECSAVMSLLDQVITGYHDNECTQYKDLAELCYNNHKLLLMSLNGFCRCGKALMDLVEERLRGERTDEDPGQIRQTVEQAPKTKRLRLLMNLYHLDEPNNTEKRRKSTGDEAIQGLVASEDTSKRIDKLILKLKLNLSGKLSGSLRVIEGGLDKRVEGVFEDVFEEDTD